MSIKTILVGLGRISFLLEKDRYRYHPCTHAGTLRHFIENKKKPGFNLIGVCDIDPDKIESFQSWWPYPLDKTETDYKKLIKNSNADLLIIAASTDVHFEIAKFGLECGVPALLIEKPVANDLKSCQRLQNLAKKKSARVWVNFERRYHPGYQLAKKYITEKKYGNLRSIHGKVLTSAPHPEFSTVGPLLHDAVHWIDLLVWMTGKPDSVSAWLKRRNPGSRVENSANLFFEYPDFSAFLESGGERNYFEFSMQIDFESGRIECGNYGHFYYKTAASKRYARFTELKPEKIKLPSGNPWLRLYEEIQSELKIKRILNPGEYELARSRITANLEDALTGMKIIEGAYRYRSFQL